MSVSRLFTIIGDGNVRRNMTGLNIASRPSMKSAQIIDVSVASIEPSLTEIRAESNVCIIAAVTGFLLLGGDAGTVAASVDPALTTLRDKIFGLCHSRPTLQVLIDDLTYLLVSLVRNLCFRLFYFKI